MNTVKTPVRKNIKRNNEATRFFEMPYCTNVLFNDENISFVLSDRRTISIPLFWIPKLENATTSVRENFTIRGHFVFWDEIDEIIGVKNLINGSIVPH
jgi:hypothetical protein